jgi:hypothetical protein
MKPAISRKEIVQLTGSRISVRTICRHEKRWGLDRARIPFGTRTVLYRYSVAMDVLRQIGLVE